MKHKLRNCILATALTGAGIHFLNQTVNRTACMKEILSYQIGQYYNWKQGKIYYTKSGNGSPLLLIHDLHPTSSSYEWKKMMIKLEKNHTVYTIDLLGCGRSDKPNITYTNFLYVQLLNSFIKEVIGERTDVVATGNSASFTLMACNMEKNLYRRIILINPQSLEECKQIPTKKNIMFKHVIDCPIIGTFIYNTHFNELNIHLLFQERYYYKKQVISTKMEDAYFESAHIGNGAGRYLYSSMISHYTNIDISHALNKIENPIFIIGSRERKHSVSIVDSYTKRNKKIETAYISNSRYLPQLETPDKLDGILTMFI